MTDEIKSGGQKGNWDARSVDTGGGAYIGGSVSTGGSFVGRDKVVYGDEVRGDKIGRQAGARSVEFTEADAAEFARIDFQPGAEPDKIEEAIGQLLSYLPQESSQAQIDEVESWVRLLVSELAMGVDANDFRVAELLERCLSIAPSLAQPLSSLLALPALAVAQGKATRYVLHRIAGK